MTAALDSPIDDALQQRLARLLATGRLDPDLLDACRDLRSVGIAVMAEGAAGRSTWDASSEPAFTACESEVLAGGGPATAALDAGELVHAPDLAQSGRPEWLVFSGIACRLGWRTAVAAPVSWAGGAGAVVVYSVEPGALAAVLPARAADDAAEGR